MGLKIKLFRSLQIAGAAALAVLAVFAILWYFFADWLWLRLDRADKNTFSYYCSLDPARKGDRFYRYGQFYLTVNLPLNFRTLVRYIIPCDRNGKPLKPAENLVFFAPYTNNASRVKDYAFNPWQLKFAEELGCSIFTLTITTNYETGGNAPPYYQISSGWGNVIIKAMNQIARRENIDFLPAFANGESSGSNLAQMMLMQFPEKFDGACWSNGNYFEQFIPANRRHGILAMNTWYDPGCKIMSDVAAAAGAGNINVINTQAPAPFVKGQLRYHFVDDNNYKLMYQFIADLIALRNNNNGVLPPPEQWPVEFDGVKMPSEEFAAIYKSIPYEAVRKYYQKSDDLLIYDPGNAEKAVLISRVNSKLQNPGVMDLLYAVGRRGGAGAGFLIGEEERIDYVPRDAGVIERRVQEVLDRPEWKNLDIVLAGEGEMGELMRQAAEKINSPRIKKVVVFSLYPEPDWAGKKTSPRLKYLEMQPEIPGGDLTDEWAVKQLMDEIFAP